ncbi:MAG: HEAT repeat domain-containing protein [Verrucomicrobia bacterium]|nr:HEAT repeat domain-containing protein [Verrucomicrobiota bacterium]
MKAYLFRSGALGAIRPALWFKGSFCDFRILLACLMTVAVNCARADQEQDLIATLQSSAGIPQKCDACQKLRYVGTVKSVPALAALLGEERTGHAARYALEGMPFPEAGAALRQALAKASGLIQAGLVDSIGWRRDTAAVPLLVPLLSGADVTLASAAASSLGRIGGKEATAALVAARDECPPAVQPTVLNSLLLCAEQLTAAGDTQGATKLCRDLNTTKYTTSIRVAAWRGLVFADADSRPELIAQALASQDRPLRTVALKVVRELNDPRTTKACVARWTSLPPDAQLAVLDASLLLGSEALPAVKAAAESKDPAVCAAALLALGDLGDSSSIPALAQAAASGEAATRAAARDALARLRGHGVREALLNYLSTAAIAKKAELLRALGERGDKDSANVLVQSAATGPEPARLAALESLRKLAVAETITPLLDIAATSKSDSERDPVLKALYAVCQASANKEQAARSVVQAMARFPAAERRRVLPLLAELATPAALDAAQAATRDPDSELVKEAVLVLTQWPDAAPAPRLLELARTGPDLTLQTLALRGCIELAGREPDTAKRFTLVQQARTAANHPSEKKQALGQLGQIPTPEALQVVLKDLADSGLAEEAGLAAVSIAETLAGADPKLAAEVAAKVLAQCKSADIVKRAWTLRGKFKSAAPFIRDWLVCGPYSQAGANDALAVFNIAFAPEKSGQLVQWKPVPRADVIDLLALFPNQTGCAAYLKTTIIAPADSEAAVLLGSDDGIKAWLDGAVVHANNIDRGAVPDQDVAPIKLKKGANELMLKVTQGGGGWAACARIVGTDGLPIVGLKAQVER